MARRKRALEVVRTEYDGEGKPSRRNRLNFFELATAMADPTGLAS